MKKLFFLFLLCTLFGWTGCSNDEEHTLRETVTEADGTVYTVFHLEVAVDLDKHITDKDEVDLQLLNQTDQSLWNLRLKRDMRKKNCLTIYVPEGFPYREGAYQTYLAKRNGDVFTFPVEVECTEQALTKCSVSEPEHQYKDYFKPKKTTEAPGTATNPWLIKSKSDLIMLHVCLVDDNTRARGLYFQQTDSINLASNEGGGGTGWVPVGYNQIGFSGHYDGNNKAMSGMLVNEQPHDCIGVFSILWPDASVKNLRLRDFRIDTKVTGRSSIGALCGLAWRGVVIENVHLIGGTLSGKDKVGGIVGLFGGSSLHNCTVSGVTNINATNEYAGGIAGAMDPTVSAAVSDCSSGSSTLVEAGSYAGGIVGAILPSSTVSSITVTGCINGAYRVTATNDYAGGILGYAKGKITLKGCNNDLDVNTNQSYVSSLMGNSYVGGLIGALQADGGESILSASTSSASIKAGKEFLGGLIGKVQGNGSLTIKNVLCGINGKTTLTGNYAGGVIGATSVNTLIEASFEKLDVINNAEMVVTGNYVGGAVGYSSAELTLRNLQSTSPITVIGSHVGGLVGKGATVIIDGAFVKGAGTTKISGSSMVGGLVGSIENGSLTVSSAAGSKDYFSGFVNNKGDDRSYCGGVLGYAKNSVVELTGVTVTGMVSGSTNIGGLIGKIDSGKKTVIRNCVVGIVDPQGIHTGNGTHGTSSVGGIAGSILSAAINVSGCINAAPVSSTVKELGGIVGYLKSTTAKNVDALVSGCNNSGALTGSEAVGGIVGRIMDTDTDKSTGFTVNYCTNTGAITGKYSVGGCIGEIGGKGFTRLDQLSNKGVITSTGDGANTKVNNVGGVLGRAHRGMTIQYCNNQATINASKNKHVGGIVGLMDPDNSEIANNETFNQDFVVSCCYNAGDINCTNLEPNAGGIVGMMSSVLTKTEGGIFNCYNTKLVRTPGAGSSDTNGGILGEKEYYVKVRNCYYFGPEMSTRGLTRTANKSLSVEVTNSFVRNSGKKADYAIMITEADFKKKETFTAKGWSFDDIVNKDGSITKSIWVYSGSYAGERPVLRYNEEVKP